MASIVTRPIDTTPWEIIPCGNEKIYEPLKIAIEREDVAQVEHLLGHEDCPPLAFEAEKKIKIAAIPHQVSVYGITYELPTTFFQLAINNSRNANFTIALAILKKFPLLAKYPGSLNKLIEANFSLYAEDKDKELAEFKQKQSLFSEIFKTLVLNGTEFDEVNFAKKTRIINHSLYVIAAYPKMTSALFPIIEEHSSNYRELITKSFYKAVYELNVENFPFDVRNIVINYLLPAATIKINNIDSRVKLPRIPGQLDYGGGFAARTLVGMAATKGNLAAIPYLMRLGADITRSSCFGSLPQQMQADGIAHNNFVRTLPSATSDVTKTSEVMRPHYSTTDSRIVR